MSTLVPDHVIALRDFLHAQSAVVAVAGNVNRIVLDFQKVTAAGHWLILTRAGGHIDLYVPVRRPRVDMVAYGTSRWEAARLIYAAGAALGLYDPRVVPRIAGTGVIISDIQPEGDVSQGEDSTVPGVENPVPFATQALILTVHEL